MVIYVLLTASLDVFQILFSIFIYKFDRYYHLPRNLIWDFVNHFTMVLLVLFMICDLHVINFIKTMLPVDKIVRCVCYNNNNNNIILFTNNLLIVSINLDKWWSRNFVLFVSVLICSAILVFLSNGAVFYQALMLLLFYWSCFRFRNVKITIVSANTIYIYKESHRIKIVFKNIPFFFSLTVFVIFRVPFFTNYERYLDRILIKNQIILHDLTKT